MVSPARRVSYCNADGGPAIVTDKDEYLPDEVAVLRGCGFEPYNGQTLTLNITEPDSYVFTDNITIANGAFAYSYVIPNKQGTYSAAALHGTTTVATHNFQDAWSVNPTSLVFVVEQGSNPANQTFDIIVPSNCTSSGGTITDNQTWISERRHLDDGPVPEWAQQQLPRDRIRHDHVQRAGDRHLHWNDHSGRAVQAIVREQRPSQSPSTSCGQTPCSRHLAAMTSALVIDSSASIDNTELGQMKTAFTQFVSAFLPDTPTQMSVIDFDTSANVTQGFTNNATSLNTAINAVTSGGFTNWDDAINDSNALFPNRATAPDLMVFASDGNPTEWGGNDGDPLTQDLGGLTALQKAIDEANAAKAAGIRVITLGIGNDLSTTNLAAISSWNAVTTSNFSTLATDLANLAKQLCGGTVTAHKIYDLDNNLATTGDQVNGEAWTMTTNVNSPDTSTPVSGLTDSGGQINFAINLGADADGHPGRHGDAADRLRLHVRQL